MALCKSKDMRSAVAVGHRLLGLDVGRKTIGIASCDAGWRIATPHSIIRRSKFTADMAVLFGVIADEGGVDGGSVGSGRIGGGSVGGGSVGVGGGVGGKIGGLVIGWPLEMDGSQGRRCDSVRDFTHALLRLRAEQGLEDLAVTFYDERLSTKAVEGAMLEGDLSRSRRTHRRDALAAAWILQGFLDWVNG